MAPSPFIPVIGANDANPSPPSLLCECHECHRETHYHGDKPSRIQDNLHNLALSRVGRVRTEPIERFFTESDNTI